MRKFSRVSSRLTPTAKLSRSLGGEGPRRRRRRTKGRVDDEGGIRRRRRDRSRTPGSDAHAEGAAHARARAPSGRERVAKGREQNPRGEHRLSLSVLPLACSRTLTPNLPPLSPSQLEAVIQGPPDTVYEGGFFRLDVGIPQRYPFEPPSIQFSTPIYHPNIDSSGRICLDTLNMPPKGAWKPSLNIPTVLSTIRLLLEHPNPDDGLMTDIVSTIGRDRGRGATANVFPLPTPFLSPSPIVSLSLSLSFISFLTLSSAPADPRVQAQEGGLRRQGKGEREGSRDFAGRGVVGIETGRH